MLLQSASGGGRRRRSIPNTWQKKKRIGIKKREPENLLMGILARWPNQHRRIDIDVDTRVGDGWDWGPTNTNQTNPTIGGILRHGHDGGDITDKINVSLSGEVGPCKIYQIGVFCHSKSSQVEGKGGREAPHRTAPHRTARGITKKKQLKKKKAELPVRMSRNSFFTLDTFKEESYRKGARELTLPIV